MSWILFSCCDVTTSRVSRIVVSVSTCNFSLSRDQYQMTSKKYVGFEITSQLLWRRTNHLVFYLIVFIQFVFVALKKNNQNILFRTSHMMKVCCFIFAYLIKLCLVQIETVYWKTYLPQRGETIGNEAQLPAFPGQIFFPFYFCLRLVSKRLAKHVHLRKRMLS